MNSENKPVLSRTYTTRARIVMDFTHYAKSWHLVVLGKACLHLLKTVSSHLLV